MAISTPNASGNGHATHAVTVKVESRTRRRWALWAGTRLVGLGLTVLELVRVDVRVDGRIVSANRLACDLDVRLEDAARKGVGGGGGEG